MKKLTGRVRKVNAEVIGLDVHKLWIWYSVVDRRGEEIDAGRIPADPASLGVWLQERIGRKRSHVAFEASGYSLWVHDLCVERYGKERVHVAQSRRIRAIANSQEKNDANDAFWLGYLTHEGRLPEAYVPPGSYRELRIACRERIERVRRRTRLFVRVRAHLAQLGERLPAASLRSERGRDRVREIAESIGGTRGAALDECLEEIAAQDQAIARWDSRIVELAGPLPEVQALEEHIPGVGSVLAATIVGESGPIERFQTAKAYARYTGLTPADRSSGGRTVHGAICREGSPYLRWALTQAASACLRARRGDGLAAGEWIRAKQKRMGHKSKARCAAARKLAESIWRLFRYGECFDAARCFGGRRRAG